MARRNLKKILALNRHRQRASSSTRSAYGAQETHIRRDSKRIHNSMRNGRRRARHGEPVRPTPAPFLPSFTSGHREGACRRCEVWPEWNQPVRSNAGWIHPRPRTDAVAHERSNRHMPSEGGEVPRNSLRSILPCAIISIRNAALPRPNGDNWALPDPSPALADQSFSVLSVSPLAGTPMTRHSGSSL